MEYVIRGNAVVLKCSIPSFVADFVRVESWIDELGTELQPPSDNNYGAHFALALAPVHIAHMMMGMRAHRQSSSRWFHQHNFPTSPYHTHLTTPHPPPKPPAHIVYVCSPYLYAGVQLSTSSTRRKF